jgi:glycerol-3-phosphate transporter
MTTARAEALSAAAVDRTVDQEYRRHRRSVFAGIFTGYAAYYLVRNNLALAIPDILKDYPQHSKADLGWALSALSISYGVSKFLMGSVSDRTNPKYFLPLGLLLSSAVMFVSGTAKAMYASLAIVVIVQAINGWVQGMGWPPCGKSMVHWFSTRERGLVVSTWNVGHNVGGALVATFALWGVTLFNDWGAKFYFNAVIAAAVAVLAFFLLRDTPQAYGLPPVEEYRNDYPPDYNAHSERTFTYREIFVEHVLSNKYLWAIAIANAFIYFVRYGVVNWIPTYLQTAKGFTFSQSSRGWALYEFAAIPRHHRLRLGQRQSVQRPSRAGDDSVHGADARRRRRLLAEPAWSAVDRLRGAVRDWIPDLRADHDHRPPCARPRAEKGRRHGRRLHRILRLRLRLGDRRQRRRLDRRPLGLARRLHDDGCVLRADDRVQCDDAGPPAQSAAREHR